MSAEPGVGEARRALRERMFPSGIPAVWCPLLTHYEADGSVDEERMLAHLDHVGSWVTGLLVPGSTGDGWELTEAERLRVLGLVVDQATRLKLQILVGVLKRDTGSMMASLVGTAQWLMNRTGESDLLRCLVRRRVAGFLICPPSASVVEPTLENLERELDEVLSTGLPAALYELPQITGVRLPPELVCALAERHPNLLLFKDSGGTDRVAQATPQPEGVFLVRGSEGDSATWLRMGGGPYDGLLLGSANCFPRELKRMTRDLERGRMGAAKAMAERLTQAVSGVTHLVMRSQAPGNAFAMINKAMDHFMAFGPKAAQLPPPMLHGRRRMPADMVQEAGELLRRCELLPKHGYMD